MYQFILFIHVIVAAFIILLVLVQQGKGASMGAAFGSGASSTVFGARGTGSVLYNITMICIMIFFATSIVMNYFATSAYREAGKMAPVHTQQVPERNPVAPVSAPMTAPVTAPASAPATAPVNATTMPAPSAAPVTPVIPAAPAPALPVKQAPAAASNTAAPVSATPVSSKKKASH